MLKYPKDYCVVKVPRLLNKDVDVKGHNGLNILIEAHYNPEKHVNNVGEIVSMPVRLGSGKIGDSVDSIFSFEGKGQPIYYDTNPNEVKWMSDIDCELEVGQKIWFKYQAPVLAIKEGTYEKVKDGDETYYLIKVHIRDIFCFERDGQLVGNATWTLVEPDMESWDDILIPIPELENGQPKIRYEKKFNEETGLMENIPVPVMKPKDQWLQTKTEPQERFLRGFVRYVSKPLKGEEFDVTPGELILYEKNADFKVDIDGQSYFMIKQRHIYAVIQK